MSSTSEQSGFSLLEILITLVITAFLALSVVPSMQSFLQLSRIKAQLNKTSSLIHFAKIYAINNQSTVLICPTTDLNACSSNWSDTVIAFVDNNQNEEYDQNDTLLKYLLFEHKRIVVNGPKRPISLHENGITSSTASLIFCTIPEIPHYTRGLTLSLQGRLRVSQDSNEDGVYENNSGKPLSCD